MFPKSFRYYPAVPGPKYDLDQAKQLVQKAKAAGWDGKIQYITDTAPSDVQTGLTLEAMLQAVGMTVQVSNVDPTTLALDKRTGNYQTASHGLGITDDDLGVLRSVIGNLQSTAAGNRMGYKSAQMDAALQQLLVATTDDAKKAAYAEISRDLRSGRALLESGQRGGIHRLEPRRYMASRPVASPRCISTRRGSPSDSRSQPLIGALVRPSDG